MGAINVKKMGLALGLTLVVLRVGCIIVFSVVSREQAVGFLKTLLCGIDISPLLPSSVMAMQDVIYGLIQIFILGWLVGGLMASIYNLQLGCCSKKGEKSGPCCH